MVSVPRPHRPRISARLRDSETVSPLELFFDLVFVLALTQCTALMADEPTWEGMAKGLLVLGILWWAWVGYSWLTSVVDPDEDVVRIIMFVAMAAFLVCALCVPEAFSDLGLTFAIAYGVARTCHIFLFVIASGDDPQLRRSVVGLAVSTALGVGLLATASFLDGWEQGAVWALALSLDMGGPYFFGSEGWTLVPEHFTERHGLIMIIALGESIVAIGAGPEFGITTGVVAAAILGVGIACAQWWAYFDVVALVSARRLAGVTDRRERNELARDSYSYIHFPMVAGVVLVALGLKKTLGHVDEPLELVPAVALLGGVALYLLALGAFRWRHVHSVNRRRLIAAGVYLALIPLALELPSIVMVGIVLALLVIVIALDTRSYGAGRAHLRHPAEHRPDDAGVSRSPAG